MLRDLLDSTNDWQVLDINYVGVLASNIPILGQHGSALPVNDDLIPGRLYRVWSVSGPTDGVTFLNMDGSGYHNPDPTQRVATQQIRVDENGKKMGEGTATFLNGAVSGTGAIAATGSSMSGAGLAYGPTSKTGTGDIPAVGTLIAGTGAVVQNITGTGAIAARGTAVSNAPPLVAGYLKPSLTRPPREHSRAYRRWLRKRQGVATSQDIEELEALDREQIPVPKVDLVEFPVYAGEFHLDLPEMLPQAVIDLENARTYAEALEKARRDYLLREDEEILLLLAGA